MIVSIAWRNLWRQKRRTILTLISIGFGGFLASMLAAVIGVQLAVGGMAIFLVVCLVLILLFVPQIRKLN